ELRHELSISATHAEIPDELRNAIDRDAAALPLEEPHRRHFLRDPYRIKITQIMEKLRRLQQQLDDPSLATGDSYDSDAFVAELQLLQRSLDASGFASIAKDGRIARLLTLARTFGFHLATLDIRQHSRVHEE